MTGFGTEDGHITKVITDQGEIRTSVVVDAAGAWTRLVASLAGAPGGRDCHPPSIVDHSTHSRR